MKGDAVKLTVDQSFTVQVASASASSVIFQCTQRFVEGARHRIGFRFLQYFLAAAVTACNVSLERIGKFDVQSL